MLAKTADRLGIRLILIKGMFLGADGLRHPSYVPVDVDAWADPGEMDNLLNELNRQGWAGRVSTAPHLYPPHSAELSHRYWPVEADVHLGFPGFLTDQQLVFEHLWATRREISSNGTRVCVPSLEMHALIAALHVLRDPSRPAAGEALNELIARCRHLAQRGELEDLADVAARVGALETAHVFLEATGHAPRTAIAERYAVKTDPDLQDAWRRRTTARSTIGLPWLLAARDARGAARLRVIRRILWLDRDELARHAGANSVPWHRVLGLQCRRWLRGIASIFNLLPRRRRG